MDKATIGGLITGAGLLVISILIAPGASITAFIDYPSIAVVFGGSLAACAIAFPSRTLVHAPKVLRKVFFPQQKELAPVIAQLVEFAEIARRDGILALESRTTDIDDPFILLGIQMAVDGTDKDLMEAVLRRDRKSVV